MPRDCAKKSGERFISRFLSNKLVSLIAVMGGFIPKLITMNGTKGTSAILILDQSKISDGFECLMVGLHVGERAISVAWKVVQTQGAIGFDVQKTARRGEGVTTGAPIDRFYGASSRIGGCQEQGWQYHIRLKGNLIFEHEEGEVAAHDAAQMNILSLIDACFHTTNVITNIGIIKGPGHKEPWFIAMDDHSSRHRRLDYGMRWGIKCMFSDFKSRGF